MLNKSLLNLWVFIVLVGVPAIGFFSLDPHFLIDEDRFAPGTRLEKSFQTTQKHIQVIAQKPHPSNSDEIEEVRAYILAELRRLGLTPRLQEANWQPTEANNFYKYYPSGALLQNIIALKKSAKETDVTVGLFAHYDTKPGGGPGAADDTMGVAMILSALEHLPPLDFNILAVFTDGEEIGLRGAEAFVSSAPEYQDLSFILNYEARGNAGPVIAFEFGHHKVALAKFLADHVPSAVANSLSETVYEYLPNDTDFTYLKSGNRKYKDGLPGFNFAVIDGYEAYHTEHDTFENLSKDSLQHLHLYTFDILTNLHIDQIVDLRRHPNMGRIEGANFFNIPIIGFVTGWVIIILMIPVIVVFFGSRGNFVRHSSTLKSIRFKIVSYSTIQIITLGIILFALTKFVLHRFLPDLFFLPQGESWASSLECLALWLFVLSCFLRSQPPHEDPRVFLNIAEVAHLVLLGVTFIWLPGSFFIFFFSLIGLVFFSGVSYVFNPKYYPENKDKITHPILTFLCVIIIHLALLLIFAIFPSLSKLLHLGVGFDPLLATIVASLPLFHCVMLIGPYLKGTSLISERMCTFLLYGSGLTALLSLVSRPFGF